MVEGCARHSHADYIRFIDTAFASAREVEYQVSVAARLNYLTPQLAEDLASQADETARVLAGLLQALRKA